MEHLHHFGLSQDPFSNEPDIRLFFESPSHRDAQIRVERGLRQHKGLTLLTGEGGMGKTLLSRRILEALEEEVFEATLLVMLPGAADATSILQRFARQLGVDDPAQDRAGLIGQIYEQLAIVREDGRHAVLIIDDAQIMAPDVLSELGGLLNLEYEDRRLVSMLLIGSPELDALVQNDPGIAPRVEVRARVAPLENDSATAYVAHRLTHVGGSADLIPASALEALHKLGRGRPRLLNTLADNALFEAYLSGRIVIDAMDVERAAADLGVGPDPGDTFIAPRFESPMRHENVGLEPRTAVDSTELGLHAVPTSAPDAEIDEPGVLELSNALFEPEVAINMSEAEDEFGSLSFDAGPEISEPHADPFEMALDEAEFSTDDGEALEGVFVELIEE